MTCHYPYVLCHCAAGTARASNRWSDPARPPQRVVERARIVLGSAAGDSGSTICGDVGVSRPTVTLWLDRYEAGGLAALRADRPRSGRPKRITLAEEEAIVHRTTQTTPPTGRGTHWSTRLMAEVTGLHHSTIARIWKAHGLRPHRVRSFKLSTDPAFVEKLRDVVGLYLQPPERAIVFSLMRRARSRPWIAPSQACR